MTQAILLIDAANQELTPLHAALRAQGYAPTTVLDSSDPLKEFTGGSYELVFVSLHCQGAQALCDGIRNMPEGAITPVIFLGDGKRGIHSPAEALAAGADYFFALPLDIPRVVAKVQTYVGAVKSEKPAKAQPAAPPTKSNTSDPSGPSDRSANNVHHVDPDDDFSDLDSLRTPSKAPMPQPAAAKVQQSEPIADIDALTRDAAWGSENESAALHHPPPAALSPDADEAIAQTTLQSATVEPPVSHAPPPAADTHVGAFATGVAGVAGDAGDAAKERSEDDGRGGNQIAHALHHGDGVENAPGERAPAEFSTVTDASFEPDELDDLAAPRASETTIRSAPPPAAAKATPTSADPFQAAHDEPLDDLEDLASLPPIAKPVPRRRAADASEAGERAAAAGEEDATAALPPPVAASAQARHLDDANDVDDADDLDDLAALPPPPPKPTAKARRPDQAHHEAEFVSISRVDATADDETDDPVGEPGGTSDPSSRARSLGSPVLDSVASEYSPTQTRDAEPDGYAAPATRAASVAPATSTPPEGRATLNLAHASDVVLAEIQLREAQLIREAENLRREAERLKQQEARLAATEAERLAAAAEAARQREAQRRADEEAAARAEAQRRAQEEATARAEAQRRAQEEATARAEAQRREAQRLAEEEAAAHIEAQRRERQRAGAEETARAALREAEARAHAEAEALREREAEARRAEEQARMQAAAEQAARKKAANEARRAEEQARRQSEEEALAAANVTSRSVSSRTRAPRVGTPVPATLQSSEIQAAAEASAAPGPGPQNSAPLHGDRPTEPNAIFQGPPVAATEPNVSPQQQTVGASHVAPQQRAAAGPANAVPSEQNVAAPPVHVAANAPSMAQIPTATSQQSVASQNQSSATVAAPVQPINDVPAGTTMAAALPNAEIMPVAGATSPLPNAEIMPVAGATSPLPNADAAPQVPTLGHRPVHPPTGTLAGNHDVPALFIECFEQGVTGRLDLTSDQRQKTVFFENGAPVDAYSSQIYDRMEEYLLRHGKVTRSQYQEVRAKRMRTAREVGAYLVNEGFLKTEELFAAVRGQLEETLYGLFEWDNATYAYRNESTGLTDRVFLEWDPRAIVLEGVRRKYSMERLVKAVGSQASLVGLHDDASQVLNVLRLTPDEQVAIRLLDGQRTLEDLVYSSGLEAQRIYQLVYGLVLTGAAAVVARGLDALTDNQRNADAIDRARILEKSEQVRFLDYFSMLGLTRQATPYEIERACLEQSESFEPGRFSDDVRRDMRLQLTEIVEVLGDARHVLADPDRRDAYARHLP